MAEAVPAETVRIPRYDEACVSDVLPSLLASHGVPGCRDILGLAAPTRAIVLLVDGLGWMYIQERPDLVPFLASRGGRVIDSPCPSTTVTGIASLGTGRPPGEHGLVGYTIPSWEQRGRRLNLLTWKFEHTDGSVVDALDSHPPESEQPTTTMLARAAAAGVATTAVLAPAYTASGLTRAALRGAEIQPAEGLEATLATAIRAAGLGNGALVYAHHGEVDRAGHGYGPETQEWEDVVAHLDELLEQVAVDLPADVALYVTAGHGMVGVPPDGFVELADQPALMAGIEVFAGEPRFRHLRTAPGARDDVVAAWTEELGHRFVVVTREQARDAGWFGPYMRPAAFASLGDVLALPRGMSAAVHRDLDPQWWRLSGHHGAMTQAEVEVPLIRIDRTA